MLGKKVIVTGGSLGIGASLVEALVLAGASVASMARGVEAGEEHAARLAAIGPGKVRFYRCDVSDRDEVNSAFASAVADMDGLDGLLHVAGVETTSTAEDLTDAQWDYVLDINLKGTFIANQEAFAYLRERGGRIVNFGSGAGVNGYAMSPAYAASKGGVLSWTRSIASGWAKFGITANVVNPWMMTPMAKAHLDEMPAAQRRIFEDHVARAILIGGQPGDPGRDLAPFVLFLLSEGAGFITGQTFNVDGGAVMSR